MNKNPGRKKKFWGSVVFEIAEDGREAVYSPSRIVRAHDSGGGWHLEGRGGWRLEEEREGAKDWRCIHFYQYAAKTRSIKDALGWENDFREICG